MHCDVPRGDRLWSFLLAVDRDLAEETRQRNCSCGGRLHSANYPRRPRGCPDDLPDAYRYRLSFCCDREGCRKRVTPPSVRFLGRKVYLSVMVVLLTAMQQGASSRRVRELSKVVGADRRTIARWQAFWREHFPRTPFWKIARARLLRVLDVCVLPLGLVEAFVHGHDPCREWASLLRFLSPITITGGLVIKETQ